MPSSGTFLALNGYKFEMNCLEGSLEKNTACIVIFLLPKGALLPLPLEPDGGGRDEAHGGLEHLARRLDGLVLLLLHLLPLRRVVQQHEVAEHRREAQHPQAGHDHDHRVLWRRRRRTSQFEFQIG